jgi:hypothetical protein
VELSIPAHVNRHCRIPVGRSILPKAQSHRENLPVHLKHANVLREVQWHKAAAFKSFENENIVGWKFKNGKIEKKNQKKKKNLKKLTKKNYKILLFFFTENVNKDGNDAVGAAPRKSP